MKDSWLFLEQPPFKNCDLLMSQRRVFTSRNQTLYIEKTVSFSDRKVKYFNCVSKIAFNISIKEASLLWQPDFEVQITWVGSPTCQCAHFPLSPGRTPDFFWISTLVCFWCGAFLLPSPDASTHWTHFYSIPLSWFSLGIASWEWPQPYFMHKSFPTRM